MKYTTIYLHPDGEKPSAHYTLEGEFVSLALDTRRNTVLIVNDLAYLTDVACAALDGLVALADARGGLTQEQRDALDAVTVRLAAAQHVEEPEEPRMVSWGAAMDFANAVAANPDSNVEA
jgi:hypothetical protein